MSWPEQDKNENWVYFFRITVFTCAIHVPLFVENEFKKKYRVFTPILQAYITHNDKRCLNYAVKQN